MHTVYSESVYYLKAQNSPEEARMLETPSKVHRHSILNVFFSQDEQTLTLFKGSEIENGHRIILETFIIEGSNLF